MSTIKTKIHAALVNLYLGFKERKRKIKKNIDRCRYRKKYTANDVVEKMKEMGMQEGDNVFIHSSMREFYNYKGTANDLIRAILEAIGPEGTLMMPAYPHDVRKIFNICYTLDSEKYDPSVIHFDVKNTRSGAGALSEAFRKYPGVKRSINVQHSVCAIGKNADYFLCEHYKSYTAWDEYSPYYKMTLNDTKVFAFGLPYFLTTCIHCTDSLMRTKNPYFALHFGLPITYNYIDENGVIGHANMLVNNIKRVRDKKYMVVNYFDPKEFHKSRISNLSIEMVHSKYTHELFMSLAAKGIVMYTKPSPEGYFSKSS